MLKRLKVWGVVATALILILATGCGAAQKKAEQKISDKIAGQAIGGKVESSNNGVKIEANGTTIETGQDLKWPQQAMGDLPQPNGKITAVMNSNSSEGCTVNVSEMSLDDAKAYVAKLKALGYKDGLEINGADGRLYTVSGENSSGASAGFTYDADPKEGTIYYKTAKK